MSVGESVVCVCVSVYGFKVFDAVRCGYLKGTQMDFNLCAKSVFKANSKCTNNKFKQSTNHEIRIVRANNFLSNALYKRFVQFVLPFFSSHCCSFIYSVVLSGFCIQFGYLGCSQTNKTCCKMRQKCKLTENDKNKLKKFKFLSEQSDEKKITAHIPLASSLLSWSPKNILISYLLAQHMHAFSQFYEIECTQNNPMQ